VCQALPVRGRRIRLGIGVIGTIAAIAGAALALRLGLPASSVLLNLSIALTFLLGGLAIWDREPANRTGRLMALVGLTWFVGTVGASEIPVLNEIALGLEDTPTIILLALILAYPSGRLKTRVDRVGLAIVAVGATGLNILFSTSLPLLADKSGGLYGGLLLAALTAVLVARRWLITPRRSRPEMQPVLVAGVVFLSSLMISLVARIAAPPEDVGVILRAAKDLVPAAIPIALLIGFNRQSERRLRAVVDAVPDRMVRFARDGHYLDIRAGGAPDEADGPDAPAGRRLHDLMFAVASQAALAAAGRALDSGDLQAFDFNLDLPSGERSFEARVAPSGPDEVTAIVRDFTAQRAGEAELQRSRARIVEASDAERRRLERDLHDGAQQRLVSLSLALRLLRSHLASTDQPNSAAISAADDATGELKVAIKELRELARGIHPAILTEAGLGAAMTALADRSPVPTSVGSLPDRRLSSAVEATAYFVVSEALANVAKYANATGASIGAECNDSRLRVEIGDDGVGGADVSRGTGIRGLQDRVAALGGWLTVASSPGQGTLVVAEIPIA
jgi:signal transduction histidine kinase